MAISVLMVDDREDVRLLFITLLKLSSDFDVIGEAENGLDGVKMVRETKPDVVLLDIQMPVMSGIEAVPLMRHVSPTTKIVFLTGLDRRVGRDLPKDRQADAVLPKGISASDLHRCIKEILDK